MHAQAAASLWPQLEATGLTLVSPAVASNAATPGSWLDQFMSQGLRVDAVALHWFCTDFGNPGACTAQLQANISAVYARYQRPIWLTQVGAAYCLNRTACRAVNLMCERACVRAVWHGQLCYQHLPHLQSAGRLPE